MTDGFMFFLFMVAPAFGYGSLLVFYNYKYGWISNMENEFINQDWVTCIFPPVFAILVACAWGLCVYAEPDAWESRQFYAALFFLSLYQCGAMLVARGIFHVLFLDSALAARQLRFTQEHSYNIDLSKYSIGDHVVTLQTDFNNYSKCYEYTLRLHVVGEKADMSGCYKVLKCIAYKSSFNTFTQDYIDKFVTNHFNSAVAFDIIINKGAAMTVAVEPKADSAITI